MSVQAKTAHFSSYCHLFRPELHTESLFYQWNNR